MSRQDSPEKLVHLGCGPYAKATHWEEYDGSWNAWINRLPALGRWLIRKAAGSKGRTVLVYPAHVQYLNLLKNFPFASSSVDGIYASHVWEHLYYDDALFATRECFRVLKPNGLLRLVVPDLHAYCSSYVSRYGYEAAAIELHRKLMYRDLSAEKRKAWKLYNALTDFHTHKFMYDAHALIGMLARCGFKNAVLRDYLSTDLPRLEEVEGADRVGNGNGIAIEARR